MWRDRTSGLRRVGGCAGLRLPPVLTCARFHPPLRAAAFTSGSYCACVGLGVLGAGATLLLTSRFLLSYFPSLEKAARRRPAAALYRLVTLADPVLDPITRGLFRQVSGRVGVGRWLGGWVGVGCRWM